MMKKILIIFAALLLLTSCVAVKETEGDEMNDNQVSKTLDEVLNAEIPDASVADDDSDTSENGDGNTCSEMLFEFIPDDYGKLLVYVGEYSEIHAVNSYEEHFSKYGLCTEDGRIVVDARDDVISDFRCFDTKDGFSFYAIGVGKVKDFSYDGYHPKNTYIIPQSGKWCAELEEGWFSFVCDFGGICASLCDLKKVDGVNYDCFSKTILFDYNGNLINEFGESKYIYSTNGESFSLSLFDDDIVTYNKFGEVVENPPVKGHSFNEYGVRIVCHEQEYFLENENGDLLNQTPYARIDYIINADKTNGVFVALNHPSNDENKLDFFGMNGEEYILDSEVYAKQFQVFFPENGDIICYFDHMVDDMGTYANIFLNITSGEIVYENRSDGMEFYKSNDKLIVAQRRFYGGGFGRILDYTGKELAYFDDFYSFDDVADNGRFITYTSLANYYYDVYNEGYSVEKDERKTYVYDVVSAEPLCSIHGNSSCRFVGVDDRFVVMFNHDKLEGGNTYNYCIYDTDKKELVLDGAEDIRYYQIGGSDYFVVSYLDTSVLYDSEMNEIIRTTY